MKILAQAAAFATLTMCTGVAANVADLSSNKVKIAYFCDLTASPWAEDIFRYTVDFINNKTDGWFDDIDIDVEYEIYNTECSASAAMAAYWESRPVNAVIGPRCSGESIATARATTLDNTAQVSMTATSAILSDKDQGFGLFSRLAPPDNEQGTIGAVAALLNAFGWQRVMVIGTDSDYARSSVNEFKRLWTGDVAYSDFVSLTSNGTVADDDVLRVLEAMPTDEPSVNSRIAVIFGHTSDVYEVLRVATQSRFQPDTVFVGAEWVDHLPSDHSWMPQHPGYIGVTSYRNRDAHYQHFITRLQQAQAANGKEVWEELSDYQMEFTVDAVLAMAMALDVTPAASRNDGAAVTRNLRSLEFNGVSGHVSFTDVGDRQYPKFTVFNLQRNAKGDLEWKTIGSTGVSVGSARFKNNSRICFADTGCVYSKAEFPSDRYPEIDDPIDWWVLLIIAFCALLLVLLVFFIFGYLRGKRKKETYKEKIDAEIASNAEKMEMYKKKQEALLLERGKIYAQPESWSGAVETLVLVPENDEQYWTVTSKLQADMPDAHIAKLWRIENTPLWALYSFNKDRFTKQGVDHNEKQVWHGTSGVDPANIYNDENYGFMMQFSAKGLWGRGIYFADKSEYSHSYAFKPRVCCDDRAPGLRDEREMFLAKLLTGRDTFMSRDNPAKAELCSKLFLPPVMDQSTGRRFSSVTGKAGGSKIWIVYENGRAYPDYLVRYYRGERDPQRTPFANRWEAIGDSIPEGPLPELQAPQATWEYLDNADCWKPYSKEHQIVLENTFQAYGRDPTSSPSNVDIQGSRWMYRVNVVDLIQTNVEHPSRTQRNVRRKQALLNAINI